MLTCLLVWKVLATTPKHGRWSAAPKLTRKYKKVNRSNFDRNWANIAKTSLLGQKARYRQICSIDHRPAHRYTHAYRCIYRWWFPITKLLLLACDVIGQPEMTCQAESSHIATCRSGGDISSAGRVHSRVLAKRSTQACKHGDYTYLLTTIKILYSTRSWIWLRPLFYKSSGSSCHRLLSPSWPRALLLAELVHRILYSQVVVSASTCRQWMNEWIINKLRLSLNVLVFPVLI